MHRQLFKQFHATRENIIKTMVLIKFQEYFQKMYSYSGALTVFSMLFSILFETRHFWGY